jgi:membrane protein YqaA with SNARE-associated domain
MKNQSTQGLSQPPAWLGFLWGFAESTLFFIIPDVLLSWASLAGARCGVKLLAAILAGALVAGIVMYAWASAEPAESRAAVAAVPFVRERMFEKVTEDYQEHGLTGMLYGPNSGVPYKIYAILAPSQHQPLQFVLLSIPARLERLALSWLVFTGIGLAFQRWIRRHRPLTAVLFVAFWSITYAIYWSHT